MMEDDTGMLRSHLPILCSLCRLIDLVPFFAKSTFNFYFITIMFTAEWRKTLGSHFLSSIIFVLPGTTNDRSEKICLIYIIILILLPNSPAEFQNPSEHHFPHN